MFKAGRCRQHKFNLFNVPTWPRSQCIVPVRLQVVPEIPVTDLEICKLMALVQRVCSAYPYYTGFRCKSTVIQGK